METDTETESDSDNSLGQIYVLWNEMYRFYGEDVVKIGRAKNVLNRKSSYVTSYVKPVEVVYTSELCKNCVLAEYIIFKRLQTHRLAHNREFFDCPIQTVKDVIAQTVFEVDIDIITSKNDVRSSKQQKPKEASDKRIIIKQLVGANVLPEHCCKKARVIKQRESAFGMRLNNLNEKRGEDYTVDFDEVLFSDCKNIFKISRDPPKTYHQVMMLYVSLVKTAVGKGIITSKQLKTKKHRDITVYTLNQDYIDELLNVDE